MRITYIALALLLVAPYAFAQTDSEIDLLVDQEIADQDLEADLEAEVLPSDGFRFVLENALFRIRRAFTFQAEHKVAVDQARLHKLDRKLAACTEIGDQECVDRIEALTQKAEERAERFFERKAEVLGNIEENFEEWRTRREEHLEEKKAHLEERVGMREELKEEFKERREEAIEHRGERLEELHNMRAEFRDRIREHRMETFDTVESRKKAREVLIETRSDVLKDKLDATRQRAQEHKEELEGQIEN